MLLAAVPEIRAAVGDLEVVVAGQGNRRLPAWCTSLGTVPDQDKAALLRSADVFVAPHQDRESFGIVLLEAMASGAPVVASDLPPFVDLLGHGRPDFDPVGDVFRVGDAHSLARTVTGVLRHPNPERMGRAQQLARQYDWSRVGAAVLSVYRATLAAGPATHARAAR